MFPFLEWAEEFPVLLENSHMKCITGKKKFLKMSRLSSKHVVDGQLLWLSVGHVHILKISFPHVALVGLALVRDDMGYAISFKCKYSSCFFVA